MLWTADMLDRDNDKKKSLWYGLLKPALPLVPILVLLKMEPHNSAMMLFVPDFCYHDCLQRLRHAVVAAGWCGYRGGRHCLREAPCLGRGLRRGPPGRRMGPDPTNTAGMQWQTRQSIYAICTGGLFGVGIGNSVQKHQWLPYAENDFVFAVISGEELGFVGAIALIALFAALVIKGIFIALRAPDLYGTLLGIGIVSQVAWQVFCTSASVRRCCLTRVSVCRSSPTAAPVCCCCWVRWACY